MLPHFARYMGKDIALAWKIDTKHRARQHLRHRPLSHDLSFLRHGVDYTLKRLPLKLAGPRIADPIGSDQVTPRGNILEVPGVSTMLRFVDVRSWS